MEICTIGFTQKGAARFFGLLREARIERLADIRLNNTSQLAGFARRDDLEFFLREICGADYVHLPLLAPTAEILDAYRKNKGDWDTYERQFLDLMASRQIQKNMEPGWFLKRTVLLCSEHTPDHCHRRLVAEYLRDRWGNVEIVHLV